MRRADAAGNCQMLRVHSRKSSRLMVAWRLGSLGRRQVSLQRTRMYSWTSRSVGLVGDFQLPQAVEDAALAALS